MSNLDKRTVETARSRVKNIVGSKPNTSKINAFPKNLESWAYNLNNEYATDIKGAKKVSKDFYSASRYFSTEVSKLISKLADISDSIGSIEVTYKPCEDRKLIGTIQ